MKTKAQELGDITRQHMVLFAHVKLMLDCNFPGMELDGLDCHQVCAKLLPEICKIADLLNGVIHPRFISIKHWKGKFNHFDHSWLVVETTYNRVIIDPYPWCSAGGPLMVVDTLPWSVLYDGEPVK